MFSFLFTYSDGNTYKVNGVNKVIIQGSAKEYSSDEILNTTFPLKTMSLYTPDKNITVSGTNLMVIDILKQKD